MLWLRSVVSVEIIIYMISIIINLGRINKGILFKQD